MQSSYLLHGLAFLVTFVVLSKMLSFLFATVSFLPLLSLTAAQPQSTSTSTSSSKTAAPSSQPDSGIDLSWHPPTPNPVSNLHAALHSTGTHNFIFNSSTTPRDVPYSTYNWCNMPHVRRTEYPRPPSTQYALKYVEVIQRHHKRTPYAANTFPHETQPWLCGPADAQFYFGGSTARNDSAAVFWQPDNAAPENPFAASAGGFPGDCAFPQITGGGIEDAVVHGRDLAGVYFDMLGLVDRHEAPLETGKVRFRVTNNVITSQVAGALLYGMFGTTAPVGVSVQSSDIDSLEPTYSCPQADNLFASYGVGSNNPTWDRHLDESKGLLARLDALSGVDPSDPDWHTSYDHYFDNLSARLCHNKPLPCSNSDSGDCVSQSEANEVFRLGEWEYSFIYRAGGSDSLAASTASFGVWVAELSEHLRSVRDGTSDGTAYRHNVAHDGSTSRLLSILQVDKMVWPGMGSEIVFELYQSIRGESKGHWFVRILWGGQVLHSSTPVIGKADMVPLNRLLAYFDGLVGRHASLIPSKCGESS